jgi:uncharacterized protein
MDITPLIPVGKKVIHAYGGGTFTINEEKIQGNILIFPDKVEIWPVSKFEEIVPASFSDLDELSKKIEILLIGCGDKHQPLPKLLKESFIAHGISGEMMLTGAACRTYNVLLSEGRRVAAALIAV